MGSGGRMTTLSLIIAAGIRCLLVILFLPFSALDKVLNFRGAVGQASEVAPSRGVATALICVGLFVEVVMSLGIVTGIADRLAAFVMAGYCGTTALLWKQFWRPGDFFASGQSKARELFWDFLKNFSLAAGFLLVTFGTGAGSIEAFLANPTASSHPYRVEAPAR
jgi:putative oxidoreductase